MLVNHLRNGIAQQYDILIKRFNLPLQFDAVYQIDGNGHMLATQCIEERVLQQLAFIAHAIFSVLFKAVPLESRKSLHRGAWLLLFKKMGEGR